MPSRDRARAASKGTTVPGGMGETVLVMGARGRIGREVLRALGRLTSTNVRVLVRRPSASLEGVEVRIGDLADRASLDAALAGVDAAFFVTPHDEREEQLGENFVAAAESAKVRRIVFASAYHPNFTSRLGSALFTGLTGALTHYGPKLRVEHRVRFARVSPVLLLPSNFYQNDESYFAELREGRYPQPLGTLGVNRVDCADIGDAAARALTDPSVGAGGYPLVGPEVALTGSECAAVWSKALGREVRYTGELATWPALIGDRLAPREREDFGKTYALFAKRRVPAATGDLARTTALLGSPPRAYAEYVADAAARMLAAA